MHSDRAGSGRSGLICFTYFKENKWGEDVYPLPILFAPSLLDPNRASLKLEKRVVGLNDLRDHARHFESLITLHLRVYART